MRSRKSGYTLVELMIVMSITAITFFLLPSFKDWQSILRTNSTIRSLANDLRLARSKAVDKNIDVIVTLNSTDDTYSVYLDYDFDGPEISELSKVVALRDLALDVNFGSTSSRAVGGETLTSGIMLQGSPNPPMITFKPNGEAVHPGSIYMVARQDASSGNINRNRAVLVYNTGLVRLFRYDPSNPSDPWTDFY